MRYVSKRHLWRLERSYMAQKQQSLHVLVASARRSPPTAVAKANERLHTKSTRDRDESLQLDHRFQSVYDTNNNDWKDWFSPVEYVSPWQDNNNNNNTNSWLQPLDFPPADYATRHLIQLLQELYHQGEPASFDRVSVQRCNRVLQQLLDTKDMMQGRAARADAILQTMELFDSGPTTTTAVGFSPTAATTTRTSTVTRNSAGAQQQQQQQQRPTRLPFDIPKPSRETYNTVLKLYAASKMADSASSSATPVVSTRHCIPDRCQALVHKMTWRYQHLGELDMQPTAFHWNQVLIAWRDANRDWDKAAHAAKIFLEQRAGGRVDVSSYIITLLVCRWGQDKGNEKAALLGANVAVKLWQQVMEEAIVQTNGNGSSNDNYAIAAGPTIEQLPSHFYAHFLQAIRSLPNGSHLRDTYFDACFAKACQNGKVNTIVLNEFLVHAHSPKVFGRWLGRYKDSVRGKSATEASQIYFAEIPSEWKAHAD